MLGVQLLELGGLLIPLQRRAVHCRGVSMEIAQHRVGLFGHQVLAALGGHALATGPLVRLAAELLRAQSPLAMLLGTCTGHEGTVLRTAAVRYSAAASGSRAVAWQRNRSRSPSTRAIASRQTRQRRADCSYPCN
jgi:hypothetical protein